VVAESFEVDAFGLDGADFAAESDPETNFRLFGPVPAASGGSEKTNRAFALRLRPNQDFAGALETFCRERGIARAKLHGGVGSTIGARFTDGIVEPFATELMVKSGRIALGTSGGLEAELEVALAQRIGKLRVEELIDLPQGRRIRASRQPPALHRVRSPSVRQVCNIFQICCICVGGPV